MQGMPGRTSATEWNASSGVTTDARIPYYRATVKLQQDLIHQQRHIKNSLRHQLRCLKRDYKVVQDELQLRRRESEELLEMRATTAASQKTKVNTTDEHELNEAIQRNSKQLQEVRKTMNEMQCDARRRSQRVDELEVKMNRGIAPLRLALEQLTREIDSRRAGAVQQIPIPENPEVMNGAGNVFPSFGQQQPAASDQVAFSGVVVERGVEFTEE